MPSLESRVLACRLCPRLIAYHESIAAEHPGWHCRPVPGFANQPMSTAKTTVSSCAGFI